MPYAVVFLNSDKTEPRIEKQIEFLHAHFEQARESKVPQLMHKDKKTQG